MKTPRLQIVTMKTDPCNGKVHLCLSPKDTDKHTHTILEFMIQVLHIDKHHYDESSYKNSYMHRKCIKYFDKMECFSDMLQYQEKEWYIEVIVDLDDVKMYRPRHMIQLYLEFLPMISIEGNYYHNRLYGVVA